MLSAITRYILALQILKTTITIIKVDDANPNHRMADENLEVRMRSSLRCAVHPGDAISDAI
jgi:hypothetical protein